MEELLTSTFPVADKHFRLAGPDRMSIKVARTVAERPYPLRHPEKIEAMRVILDDLLKQGVVVPSRNSAFRSPALLVPKKYAPGAPIHERWRFVVDYRSLNASTLPNAYQPPPVDSVINLVSGCRYISLLDSKKAFWMLALNEEDGSSEASTFVVPQRGAFRFTRVVMGLRNASSVFQRFQDSVLAGALLTYAASYVDDLIVWSKSIEEHYEHLQYVFLRCLRHGITLNLKKSRFFCTEPTEFLGMYVDGEGVSPCPQLMQGIDSLGHPTSVKDLRAALGLFGYHRRFIRNYAEKVFLLNEAVKRGEGFSGLSKEEEKEFENLRAELKEFFMTNKKIYFVDFTKPIEVYTDASARGIGGFAFQRDGDLLKPICYVSRSVTDAEKKYHELMMGGEKGCGAEIRQLELLALIFTLDHVSALLGADHHIIVHTDHRNLLYVAKQAAKNGTADRGSGRLLRWALKLDQYSQLDLRYNPGSKNEVADAMSRLHDDDRMALDDLEPDDYDPVATAVDMAAAATERPPSRLVLDIQEQVPVVGDPLGNGAHFTVTLASVASSHEEFQRFDTHKAPLPLTYSKATRYPRMQHVAASDPTDYEEGPGAADDHGGCSHGDQSDEAVDMDVWEDGVDTSQLKAQGRRHPLSCRKIPDESHEPPTVEEILEAQNSDQFMIRVREELQSIRASQETSLSLTQPPATGVSPAKRRRGNQRVSVGYTLGDNGIVYRLPGRYRNRTKTEDEVVALRVPVIPVSPNTRALRLKIMKFCHGGLFAGHLGRRATIYRIKQRFFWANMDEEIRAFVRSCLACRLAKTPTTGRNGFLQCYEYEPQPFHTVAIDIVEFKGAQSRGSFGEKMLLVMVDIFSRFLVVSPLVDRSLRSVCQALIMDCFVKYGAPVRVIGDQAFSNEQFEVLLDLLKVQCDYVSAYNSRSNKSERYCGLVTNMLRTYVAEFPKIRGDAQYFGDAYAYVPFVVAAYNSAPMSDTGLSPFELLFGRTYKWPSDVKWIDDPGVIPTKVNLAQYYRTRKELFKRSSEVVQRIIDEAKGANAERHDALQNALLLNEGDLVLVKVPTRRGKLATQFVGPASVVGKLTDLLYKVQFLDSNKVVSVHARRLVRYSEFPTVTHEDKRFVDESLAETPVDETQRQAADQEAKDQDDMSFDEGDIGVCNEAGADLIPKLQPGTMVLLRGQESEIYYVAKVTATYADTHEIGIHYFCHQRTSLPGADNTEIPLYDNFLPLDKRVLTPEYIYQHRGAREERRIGTWNPRASYEPMADTVRIGTGRYGYQLVHYGFTLNKHNQIVELDALREIAPEAFRDNSDIDHLICVDQATSST